MQNYIQKHIRNILLPFVFAIHADRILLWMAKHTTTCKRVLVFHGLNENGMTPAKYYSIAFYLIHYLPGRITMTYDDGYESNWWIMAYNTHNSILFINTDNIGKDGYLSEKQIRSLANASEEDRIIIGSHCHTHCDLTKSTDPEYELLASKNILQRITGKEIRHFAFPYGAYDQRIIHLAGKYYDYVYIVKKHTRTVSYKEVIPRVCVSNTTTYESNIIRILLSFWWPGI